MFLCEKERERAIHRSTKIRIIIFKYLKLPIWYPLDLLYITSVPPLEFQLQCQLNWGSKRAFDKSTEIRKKFHHFHLAFWISTPISKKLGLQPQASLRDLTNNFNSLTNFHMKKTLKPKKVINYKLIIM